MAGEVFFEEVTEASGLVRVTGSGASNGALENVHFNEAYMHPGVAEQVLHSASDDQALLFPAVNFIPLA